MPKLRLWGRTTSVNVQKVLWALAEIGEDFERIDAGASYGVVDTADYAALNPNRLVPTIEDDGLVLWESNAIVRHLARKRQSALTPRDAKQEAIADQWMDWAATTLSPAFIGCFWQLVRTPADKRDPMAVAAHNKTLQAAMRTLETRLGQSEWVAGDAISMGDIPLASVLYRYYDIAIEREDLPNLARYYGRLAQRPAYRETVMTSYEALRAPGA